MTDRVLIFANGDMWNPPVIRARLADFRDARVIAADGGTRHALAMGLHVDDVVGDADSLSQDLREALLQAGTRFHPASPHKDETDLELALLLAVREGATQIRIVAALGGRADMAFANVLLLSWPALEGLDVRIWDGQQTIWLVRPPGDDIVGTPGDTLSLIPLVGDAHEIQTEGLAYPLRNETLFFGLTRGLSNVLTDPHVVVRLGSGMLLAVHTSGRAE